VIQARVYVTLKESVLDPQGQAVNTALHHMGYEAVQDVRIGKFIELKLNANSTEEAHSQVDEMSKKLLSNPVIESFRFELLDEAGTALTT
jgi:phosphoribosylformylglycinamidine synthase PurS subunit